MRLGRRIRRLIKALGRPEDVVVPVISFGDHDEKAKAKIAEVEAKGWQVHLIRVMRADRESPSALIGE